MVKSKVISVVKSKLKSPSKSNKSSLGKIKGKSKSMLVKASTSKSQSKQNSLIKKGLAATLGAAALASIGFLGYNNIKKNKKINELINDNKNKQDTIENQKIENINILNKNFQDNDKRINNLETTINTLRRENMAFLKERSGKEINSVNYEKLEKGIKNLEETIQLLDNQIYKFKNEKTGFVKNLSSKVNEIEKLKNEKMQCENLLGKCNAAVADYQKNEIFFRDLEKKYYINEQFYKEQQNSLDATLKQLNDLTKLYQLEKESNIQLRKNKN